MHHDKKGHVAVFGIYDSRLSAEAVVDTLKIRGFRPDDISILMPDRESTTDFAHERSTKAPEGAVTGVASGAVIGGTVLGIAGALIGMGIPEYEAKRYEGDVKGGAILLSVHADDRAWAKKASQILEASGARSVSSTSEEKVPHTKSA